MANQVAYGFWNLEDRFAELALQAVNIPIIENAIRASFDFHNRQLAAAMRLFVRPVVDPQLRYRTPMGGARLMPMDANGRALPV
jgi:hypothetical protein